MGKKENKVGEYGSINITKRERDIGMIFHYERDIFHRKLDVEEHADGDSINEELLQWQKGKITTLERYLKELIDRVNASDE